MNERYPLKDECYLIIGCAMETHKELGCGFLEAVYQEALSIVFQQNEIPFLQEVFLDINFRGQTLRKKYKADFVCFDNIIVEIKAVDNIISEHIAQVLNYLKATNNKVGLILNFGTHSLQYKRVIF